jgi:hypothetical protein
MLQCPYCAYQNREGVLICENCSHFMGGDMPTPLVVAQLLSENLRPPYRIHYADHEVALHLSPARLYAMRKDFPNQRLTLGRASAHTQAVLSSLAINVHNATELGVSRTHAALIPAAEWVAIEDLGSTNGTFLNGERLILGRAYRLEPGDAIHLGQLLLRVYLE